MLIRSLSVFVVFTILSRLKGFGCYDLSSMLTCVEYPSCWRHLNVEIIDMIQSNLDNHTDPCDDFWRFACGNWARDISTSLPRDNFNIVVNRYVRKMSAFLSQRIDRSASGSADRDGESDDVNYKSNGGSAETLIQDLRDYFEACSRTQARYMQMEHYLMELPRVLTQSKIPPWRTILRSFEWTENDTNFNWLDLVAEFRRIGLNGVFFEEDIGMSFNDSTRYVIELKMPSDRYDFEKKFELVNYLVEFNLVDGASDAVWDLATDIFKFEKQIKDLRGLYRHKKSDSAMISLDLATLLQKVPNVDWQRYFNIMFAQEHVDIQLPIEVSNIEYFGEIARLIEHTEPKIVSIYILLRLCKYLLGMELYNSKNCVEHMSLLMPLGMNYIFDRYVYQSQRRQDEIVLGNIFNKLKLQFSEGLRRNKMNLTHTQIHYLSVKSNEMVLRLGNLPSSANAALYNSYYSEANLTRTNFHFNHLSMLRVRFDKQHAGIFGRSKLGFGRLDPDTFYVNDDIDQIRSAPYFVHERNMLIVPMLFLQAPFFHHSTAALFHYSLVGFILAHEMNHAFEMDGVTIDAFGNESLIGHGIRQLPAFKTSMECFQRFSQTNSINERVADINGFQLAFDAFLNLQTQDTRIPGFSAHTNFSPIQLYFLNFAQFFCGQLPTPIDHDRDDVRVNEIVANMPEFLEAFKCTDAKYKLNRVNKQCEMWRTS